MTLRIFIDLFRPGGVSSYFAIHPVRSVPKDDDPIKISGMTFKIGVVDQWDVYIRVNCGQSVERYQRKLREAGFESNGYIRRRA